MNKILWIASLWGAVMMSSFAQHVCTDPNCTSCVEDELPSFLREPTFPNVGLERDVGQTVNQGQGEEESGHDTDAGHDHTAHEESSGHDSDVEHDHGGDACCPHEAVEVVAEEHDHSSHSGCAHGAEEDAHAGHDHSAHGHDDGIIRLPSEIAAKLGLQTAPATGGRIEKSVVFPAEIKLNRDHSSAVSPRYPSVIRQVFAEIGDRVKKGDVLASLENRQSLAVYTVAAPLDGVIVSKDASVGESASEDRILFEVADLSTVWADVSIFPKYQHRIKSGQDVTFIAHDQHVTKGSIKYVSPIVSHETRTLTARCVLNKAGEDFTPGAFVRAKIITESLEVSVRVEIDAVQTIEGSTVVFVAEGDGYKSRDVIVGTTDGRYAEIKRGLAMDEAYVSSGAFSLKAQMVTSGMDPHAGHGH